MPALLLSLILGMVVSTGAVHERGPVEAPVTIEIDVETGHMVLPVWIEDEGPYWFVLDTGNQNTTIFAHVAKDAALDTVPMGEMGGAGSGTLTVERASDVRVSLGAKGDLLTFVDSTVTVIPDAAQLPDFNGKVIAGFLGATLIEQYMTSIEYGLGELVFTPRDQYEMPERARIMEMKLAMGFPYFEGEVTPTLMGQKTEPVRGNYLLDLGATYGVELDYEDAHAIGLVEADDADQKLAGQGRGIDGVMFEMRTAPLVQARLGGLVIEAERVVFMTTPGGGPPIENLVGAVGSGLFKGGRVTLDYAGGRLIWEE